MTCTDQIESMEVQTSVRQTNKCIVLNEYLNSLSALWIKSSCRSVWVKLRNYTLLCSVSSPAMKNQHNFSSPVEEERALIYNFSPVYRGAHAVFVQNYYFDWWTALKTETGSVQSEFVIDRASWPKLKTKLEPDLMVLSLKQKRSSLALLSLALRSNTKLRQWWSEEKIKHHVIRWRKNTN